MNNLPESIFFNTSTITDGNMSFRIGDTGSSVSNRRSFLLKNDIDFKNHISMRCDHGEEITIVTSSHQACGATTQSDMVLSEVLVTQEKGLALMLLTADCLPVSFYDPVTETIALAHLSRETISRMLPEKTISFLQKNFEVDSSNLLIHIGPHIHTDSYSFPLPQPDLSPSIAPFIKKTETHVHIHLVAACNQQLARSGALLGNISVSEIDTATSLNHYSHYQSKKQNAPEGRLATILLLS